MHPFLALPQLAHELAFRILIAAPLALLGVLWPGSSDGEGEGA